MISKNIYAFGDVAYCKKNKKHVDAYVYIKFHTTHLCKCILGNRCWKPTKQALLSGRNRGRLNCTYSRNSCLGIQSFPALVSEGSTRLDAAFLASATHAFAVCVVCLVGFGRTLTILGECTLVCSPLISTQ